MTVLGSPNSPELDQLLTASFEAELLEVGGPPLVPAPRHFELAKTLRDDHGFLIFGFVVAVHFPAGQAENAAGSEELLRVIYGLRTRGKGTQLVTWQVNVPTGGAVPTLVPLFAGADWQEREQYDLLGVRFDGHPDLRRLMLAEDWEGHPLRKDYAIDTRVHPWR